MTTNSQSQEALLFVVMGVSGCGKSTTGQALAVALSLPFVDADALHPAANVQKMSNNIPLTDADREPWLNIVRSHAERVCAEQRSSSSSGEQVQQMGVVVACSALKRYYRDILRGTGKGSDLNAVEHQSPDIAKTFFVFIKGDRDILLRRMNARKGHFMKTPMLDSQLATLEDPTGEDGVVVVELAADTAVQVDQALKGVREMGVDTLPTRSAAKY